MHQFMFCGTWHGRRDLNGGRCNGTGEIDERQRDGRDCDANKAKEVWRR
jgi:hypothetical protein